MAQEKRHIKYPVGIQTFKDIIEGGYLYIDKTGYVKSLVESGKYFFLSRPRRFGKSLLLSTLESYFLGERELFLNLEIYPDIVEAPHPVLHIDLSNREYKDYDSLVAALNAHLERWEEAYGDEKKDRAVEERFAWIIEKAWRVTGRQVVILIDEYEKPLLSAIGNEALADRYRATLKAFYANLKTMDRCIRFAMLTGVARFTKVSVFSDLNNLNDISFLQQYSGICGITSDELEAYFTPGISVLAETLGRPQEDIKAELRHRYDGYHFSESSPDIYSPYSLIKVCENRRFDSYWFDSGTPTFLVALIRRGHWQLKDIAPVTYDAEELASAGILSRDPVPVLFQSGYLTIKSYNPEYQEYLLDYPNTEVKNGFLKFLLKSFAGDGSSSRGLAIQDFLKEVRHGNPEAFMERFNSLLAGLAYNDKGNRESRFQDAVYLIFTLLGEYTEMERRTSDGRIDLKVETSGFIYIFEFKIDSDASSALGQINRKEYWMPDRFTGKTVYLIGASFDTGTGRLSDYLIDCLR